MRSGGIVTAVRLVQVSVPTGRREAVRRVLEDRGIDYMMTDEVATTRFAAVVSFPLPQEAVEPVLEDLEAAGIDEETVTVVLEANTIVSRQFEHLQDEYQTEADEDQIARQELASSGESLLPARRNYLVLTVVSAVVATAGLLLDSPAVVVGSMVIAPLVGPALATSVGTVLSSADLRRQGLFLQVVGVLLSIAAATLFALVARLAGVIPPTLDILGIEQIGQRLAPDLLSLAVAVGAGVAGAFSLTAGVSTALVGVMIAVALIPPAAAAGIGIAWSLPTLTVSASVLVLVNLLSINMAALVVLWWQGYRPASWREERRVRRGTLARIGVLAAGILLLSGFLGAVTVANHQAAATETTIRGAATDVLDVHDHATLLSVEVEHARQPLRSDPERIVLTVGLTRTGATPPPVAEDLSDRLRTDLETVPAIEVRVVTVQTAAAHSAASNGNSGSWSMASTAASTTASTPSVSVTLM